jgi:DNA-binding transcriptional ArsR family regulator
MKKAKVKAQAKVMVKSRAQARAKANPIDYRPVARCLKVASHPGRLAILSLLADGKRHVEAMRSDLESAMRRQAIYTHLAMMRAAGLVEYRREGTRKAYR